jgi:hypothetical protein
VRRQLCRQLSGVDVRIVIILIIGVVVVAAGFFWANRPQLIPINAAVPDDFPANSFSHSGFERLLSSYVDANGYVDYERWYGDAMSIAQLDSYLAAVSAYSPESSPERFPTRNDELAYWMYGYNAYVIKSVLSNWPLDSVTDVKAPIEIVKGMGFFYRLRYLFGGRAYSLLTVENDKIRKEYKDPRIHFVLNCGSESCPVIRPELPTGDALELLLAQSAREFVNDPANVKVDHKEQIIYLAAIFKWYEDDFLNWLRANGRPVDKGLLDYVTPIAAGALADDLERSVGYAIEFRDFDWTVNATDAASSNTTH